MNILIVKCAALGDVLRTTSLLGPLKRRYPGCRVTWLTSPAARPLLEKNPFIHKITTLSAARRSLRREFDLALSMEEDARTAGLARDLCRGELVGIFPDGGRLSYTSSSAPYYDMSLLNRDPDGGLRTADALKSRNKLTYARIWLRILDMPVPKGASRPRPLLALGAKDRAAARALLKKHPGVAGKRLIGINPGAGKRWPSKQLSEDKSVEIIRALHKRFSTPILLFGGKDEAARNERITEKCRGMAIAAGTGHSLRSFAGLVDLCRVLVTTDTLALHVATALGRSAVVLVGPTSPSELDVFGRGEKVLPPGPCPCFYKPRCIRKRHCLDRIPAGKVAAAVGRCLR